MLETDQKAPDDITHILERWSQGDPSALDEAMPLVYQELKRLAHLFLRSERPDHTWETASLVHEAYLRLVRGPRTTIESRAHFFALAAQAMRRLLVDHARSRLAQKRGGEVSSVPLEEALDAALQKDEILIAVDEALALLKKMDEKRTQLVELRFFAGLTQQEVAELWGVSLSTVERQWRLARAFLLDALNSNSAPVA